MRRTLRLLTRPIISGRFTELAEEPRLTSGEHGGRLDYILRNAL